MPYHVIQVECGVCSGLHTTEIVLKLDDGPPAKESVASYYGGKAVPPAVAVRDQVFRCPATGEKFKPGSDEKVFVMPAPYRV